MTDESPRAKLVLLDGNSLVYRAFFALPYFTTADGRPTNAAYGFTTMLLKLLDEERPTHAAVAFDLPAPTFRHAEYEAYKANREAMPDDLRPQIGYAKDVVRAFDIPIFEAAGFEADDVIATLATRAEARGLDVLVVSGDLDTLQLVSDRVRVLLTSRGISETIRYDDVKVRERFGIPPARIPDYKGLRGDASDNLPGVPGVGEKTATALLQQFDTVEALIARVEEAPPRFRDKIRDAADQALSNKRLATAVRDVPIEVDWEALALTPPDPGRVTALFHDLEFKSLLQRFQAEPPPQARGTYEVGSDSSAARAVDEASIVGIALRAEGPAWAARVTGAGVSPAPGRAAYLSAEGEDAARLRAILENPRVEKVSPDAKSDILAARAAGWRPAGFGFDVGVASYVLNPGRRSHDLATVAWDRLSWRMRGGAPEAGGLGLSFASGWEDACEDADIAHRLRPVLADAMRQADVESVFRDIEMPLVEVLADIEEAGIACDAGYLDDLAADFRARTDRLASDIYALAGLDFNIGSPKQLGFVLFEKLGLPTVKKTKTGYSTDAEVLEILAPQHEIVAKILAYRELSKLQSTYVDVLPRLVDPRSGRLHTTFDQTVAATGRLSSRDPNLQNIPIRSEDGRRIRRAFVAAPGHVLVAADYSQVELRLLAHISGDEGLRDAFRAGRDVHTEVACDVFGVTPETMTPEHRRRAKVINFGIAYGISDFGLATQVGVAPPEARLYIERYFQTYPGVRAYIDNTIAAARRDGYVSTLAGRRRPLADIHSRNRAVREAAERIAINTPIQGTGADLIKLAMIRIHREVLPRFPGARMVLQVHDELLFEAPAGAGADLGAGAAAAMRTAMTLDVPIDVDVKVGANWRDLAPVPAAPGDPGDRSR
jgi:DNA polymerase-1